MELNETRVNTFGTPMRIVKIVNDRDIDVEFMDEHGYIKQHNSYVNFRRGNIKNPYDKTCWGVGYIGVGKHIRHNPNGNMNIVYNVWRSMIERCYGEKVKDKHRTYYGIVECCEEWFNYQNFAEWYEENKYECEGRLHLDKDILYPGNKKYSPQRCLLVPQRINMIFQNLTNKNGLPNGVEKHGDKYSANYRGKVYGKYDTVEEAYSIYAEKKKQAIVAVANEYRDRIPAKVYDAMMNYEVRIENDKNYRKKDKENV